MQQIDHPCDLQAMQVESRSVAQFLFKGAGIHTWTFLICPVTEAAVSWMVIMCFNQANHCLFSDCICRSTFDLLNNEFTRMVE